MIIKRRYKKFISIILVIAMLITNLAGCGKNGQSTTQNQGSISTVSDAQIYDFENTVHEDKTTSVLTQEEIDKIESVSAKIDESGEDISSLLESIASGNSYTEENIEKLGAALDSSEESVEDWIELQSELYISVSDDLSEEAAELLKNRQDEESLKLHESIETAETKYTELMAAYESGDKEKISEMTEELTEMFNGEIPSYGSEESRTVRENINYDKNIQNLISPKVSTLIDDSEEVREFFEYKFETPLEAYEYIKNNVYTQFYYGRKKTVLGTYESCSGNDYDQAVLLASILDSMGYETKYVRGNILLTPEMALSMTGADNVEIAANIIAMAGVPTTKLLAKDGNIKSIKIEHVWVRAEIPYTDYRGAGNASGDMVWVDLDTSIKFYEKADNIYDYLDNDDTYIELCAKCDKETLDYSQVYDYLNIIQNKVETGINNTNALHNRRRKIRKENCTYIPLSLQYEVKDELEVTDSIDVTDSLNISVSGEDLGTYSAVYLSDKSVVISFDPASDLDVEILESNGGIYNVGANYVNVKPALYIDGIKVSEADYIEYPLGTSTTLELTMNYVGNCSESKCIKNNIISGSTYAVTVDTSVISNREMCSVNSDLLDKKSTISEKNALTRDYIGTILAYEGKSYFAQLDAMDIITSESTDVVDIRQLSEAVTGYEVRRKMIGGIVLKLQYGNFFIDVDSDDHVVISRDGEKNKEILYRYNIGCAGSMCEGLIWPESLLEDNIEAVSTINILEKAREQGIEIEILKNDIYIDYSMLDSLELDENEKTRIKKDIEAGNIISIPKENVTIGRWTGIGYISINPHTGIGTYKISGGLSGGTLSLPKDAGDVTVRALFACIAETIASGLVMYAISVLTIPGPLGGLLAGIGVLLLFQGLYIVHTMMIAYADYMAEGGVDDYIKFIDYFEKSMFMSIVEAYYSYYIQLIEMMYLMWKNAQQAEYPVVNTKDELKNEIKEIREQMPNSNLSKRGNMAAADVHIDGIKEKFYAHSKIDMITDKGAEVADFSFLKEADERVFTSYVADGGYSRYHDTEAKILEDIASQIKDPNISGSITLYSELPCCQSCSNIIMEFRRMFPNIKLDIVVE